MHGIRSLSAFRSRPLLTGWICCNARRGRHKCPSKTVYLIVELYIAFERFRRQVRDNHVPEPLVFWRPHRWSAAFLPNDPEFAARRCHSLQWSNER